MTILLSDCDVNLGNYTIWLAKYPCDENIVEYKGKPLYIIKFMLHVAYLRHCPEICFLLFAWSTDQFKKRQY